MFSSCIQFSQLWHFHLAEESWPTGGSVHGLIMHQYWDAICWELQVQFHTSRPILTGLQQNRQFLSALDVFSDGVGDHKSALKPKSHSYLPYELCSLICNYYTTKLAIKPWSIWRKFYLTSKLSISVLYVLTYKWGYITVKKYSSKVYTIATKSVH